jgi:Tfp pilus assembly protein PilZ
MSEETLLAEDAYEAMRIAANMDADDPRQAQLSSYVDVMASAGFGILDQVDMQSLDAETDEDPKFHIHVNWASASDVWRAAKRNINKNGLFIQVDPTVQMGDTVTIQVDMQRPPISFGCSSKVIWASPQERSGRPMGLGVKFLWDDDEKSALFKRFVKGEIDPMELSALGGAGAPEAAAAQPPSEPAEAVQADAEGIMPEAAMVEAAADGSESTPAA